MDVKTDFHDLATSGDWNTLVTFRLDQQVFALPIGPIRQIIEMVTLTPVPQMRDYVEGVMNFHGSVVPVVNLRRYLSMPKVPLQLHTPIILVSIGRRMIGLIVDEVLDVMSCSAGQMVQPKEILPEGLGELPLLRAMVQAQNGMVMLLDLDQLFSPQQAQLIMEAAEAIKQKVEEDLQAQPEPEKVEGNGGMKVSAEGSIPSNGKKEPKRVEQG